MQSNTTWKSVHHLPTHGYQLFLVSSPTYCGVSCKSVHTFYAMLLIDKNHNHPWKIENKSDILLTDTNSCIVTFHPIPPISFYVSDPSIHPPSKYHYAIVWIMVISLKFTSRTTQADASLPATPEAGTGCQAGHYCQRIAGHTGADVVSVCR